MKVWCNSYSELSETRGCFIAMACHLCFRIWHYEGPRKWGREWTKWHVSAPGLC